MEIKLTTSQRQILVLIATIFVVQLFTLTIGSALIRYIFENHYETSVIKLTKVSLQINLQLLAILIQFAIKFIKHYFNSIVKDIKIMNNNVDLRSPEINH
jgi:hypothetical protein